MLFRSAFGAYTTHNSLADIVLMLASTAVGVVAIRYDWPRAPLLLALVLGDIAERYLFLSYSLYEWTWLTRPLVLGFAIVTLGGLAWPFVRARRARRTSTRSSAPDTAEAGPTPRAPGLLNADGLITLLLLAASLVVLGQARTWPFRAAVFPLAAGATLLFFSVVKAALSFTAMGATAHPGARTMADDDEAEEAGDEDVILTATRAQWTSALGWMAVFFGLLWVVGALVTVPLFALVYLLVVSRESIVTTGVYALVSWAFVYGLFDRLLHVPLPAGALLTGF